MDSITLQVSLNDSTSDVSGAFSRSGFLQKVVIVPGKCGGMLLAKRGGTVESFEIFNWASAVS